jgi:hypothetical protein
LHRWRTSPGRPHRLDRFGGGDQRIAGFRSVLDLRGENGEPVISAVTHQAALAARGDIQGRPAARIDVRVRIAQRNVIHGLVDMAARHAGRVHHDPGARHQVSGRVRGLARGGQCGGARLFLLRGAPPPRRGDGRENVVEHAGMARIPARGDEHECGACPAVLQAAATTLLAGFLQRILGVEEQAGITPGSRQGRGIDQPHLL